MIEIASTAKNDMKRKNTYYLYICYPKWCVQNNICKRFNTYIIIYYV